MILLISDCRVDVFYQGSLPDEIKSRRPSRNVLFLVDALATKCASYLIIPEEKVFKKQVFTIESTVDSADLGRQSGGRCRRHQKGGVAIQVYW